MPASSESNFFFDNYYSVILTATVGVLSFLTYLVYKRFDQGSTEYNSVSDNNNDLLKAKMEAARLKQQESYNKTLKENEEKKKAQEEKVKQEALDNLEKPKDDKALLAGREYFPLAGSGIGSSYRPEKKRACGPCGGGC